MEQVTPAGGSDISEVGEGVRLGWDNNPAAGG